ncbi:MAG: hypothetical protein R8P61_13590 [Bacteroidia bacterium]|nr:hypothetical protein [Bacteroidia bacterium]
MNHTGSILVLHSSVTNQVEAIANEMAQILSSRGLKVVLSSSPDEFSREELAEFDLVCLGTENADSNFRNETEIFAHERVALFATSRRSLFYLRKRADKLGARIVNLALFPIGKSPFYAIGSWLNSILHVEAGPEFPGFEMHPFGINEEESERIGDFSKSILRQFAVEPEVVLA